ncbi:hypothetical protein [Rhodococcus sp. Q]|nr:hypothetical protein [Rhodococcus sp. Q]
MGSLANPLDFLLGVQPINAQSVGSSISPLGFGISFGSLGGFEFGLGS